MGTLNSNEQLFGLAAVKANTEALAAHEERAKFTMLSELLGKYSLYKIE